MESFLGPNLTVAALAPHRPRGLQVSYPVVRSALTLEGSSFGF
jgi:hypothetical protein